MNILESFLQGRAARQQQDRVDRENAMYSFLSQNGEGIFSGDPGVLGQLAGFDLVMAMNVRNMAEERAYRAEDMDIKRARFDREGEIFEYEKLTAQEQREAQMMRNVLGAAKTPEEWAAGIKFLQGIMEIPDDEAGQVNGMWENREMFLNSLVGSAGQEYGLTPQFIVGSDGELQMLQLSSTGQPRVVDLPPGSEIASAIERVDTGTEILFYDRRTGQMVGSVLKDNEAAAAATTRGAATAEEITNAQRLLPQAEASASLVSTIVADLISDPYLPKMIGPIASRKPNLTAEAARVQALIDQVKGQAFMQARAMLKGGGQITDYEGERAEAAFIRLNESQNIEDFTKALNEFNDAVQQGLANLRRSASGEVFTRETAAPGSPRAGADFSQMDALELYQVDTSTLSDEDHAAWLARVQQLLEGK